MIVTPRSTLITATSEFLRAVIAGDRVAAGALIDVSVCDEWPGSTDAVAGLPIHLAAIEAAPDEQPWRIRLVIANRQVVGSINLKGRPNQRGDVEIGWGLVPSARGRGLATEAAHAVIDWTFTSPRVQRVTATIPPDHERSQRVALRLGMQPTPELQRDLVVWAVERR